MHEETEQVETKLDHGSCVTSALQLLLIIYIGTNTHMLALGIIMNRYVFQVTTGKLRRAMKKHDYNDNDTAINSEIDYLQMLLKVTPSQH
jgi:hypothetical protein